LELSVIIVSWNVANLLADCLRSIQIQQNTIRGLEVFVVDNASSDNTVELVLDQFPWVRLITNPENRGFAVANNQGIIQATGDYVMLLNPDTVVIPNCFRVMIDFLKNSPQIGLAGPRLVSPNGDVQATCARRLPTLASELWLVALPGGNLPVIGPYLRRKLAYPYDYRLSQPVEAVLGAAMLVRRMALTTVGPLDEDFYYCGEDIEWCARMRRAGWQVQYIPEAEVLHYSGQSQKQTRVASAINSTLSVYDYYLKVFGKESAFVYKWIMRMVCIPKILLIAGLRYLLGQISASEFQQRTRIASGILRWEKVSQTV